MQQTTVQEAKWFEVRTQEDQYDNDVYYVKAKDMNQVIAYLKKDIKKHYRRQFNLNANWSDEKHYDTYIVVGRGEGFTYSYSIYELDKDEEPSKYHRQYDITQ